MRSIFRRVSMRNTADDFVYDSYWAKTSGKEHELSELLANDFSLKPSMQPSWKDPRLWKGHLEWDYQPRGIPGSPNLISDNPLLPLYPTNPLDPGDRSGADRGDWRDTGDTLGALPGSQALGLPDRVPFLVQSICPTLMTVRRETGETVI